MSSLVPPSFATTAVYEFAISSMRVTYLVNITLLDLIAYLPLNKISFRLCFVQSHSHSKQII
jgi:hypothetical protein